MLAGEISQANQESSLSATAWQENSATSDFATDASRAQDYKLEQPDPPSSINQAQAGLSATTLPPPSPLPKPPTKGTLVRDLLSREDGATLTELTTATGWQEHSVRAMLTGLRKSGLVLEKSIRAGATVLSV
mgnify:FL=1